MTHSYLLHCLIYTPICLSGHKQPPTNTKPACFVSIICESVFPGFIVMLGTPQHKKRTSKQLLKFGYFISDINCAKQKNYFNDFKTFLINRALFSHTKSFLHFVHTHELDNSETQPLCFTLPDSSIHCILTPPHLPPPPLLPTHTP